MKNHQPVTVQEYTAEKTKVPSPEEIPNIDLQVINFHRPTFGTFHSKFMVVDRKFGVVSSNNIQVSLYAVSARSGANNDRITTTLK